MVRPPRFFLFLSVCDATHRVASVSSTSHRVHRTDIHSVLSWPSASVSHSNNTNKRIFLIFSQKPQNLTKTLSNKFVHPTQYSNIDSHSYKRKQRRCWGYNIYSICRLRTDWYNIINLPDFPVSWFPHSRPPHGPPPEWRLEAEIM